MKNLTLISVAAIIALFAACKKDTINEVNASLTGNWRLVAAYISTGSPGKWYDLTGQSPKYVNFLENKTVTGNQYPDYMNYSVKDSTTLSIFKKNFTDTLTFFYKIKKDTLVMSPNGKIMCIEGCAVKFVKQK